MFFCFCRKPATYPHCEPMVYSEDGIVVYLDESNFYSRRGKQKKGWSLFRFNRRKKSPFVVANLARQSKILHPMFMASNLPDKYKDERDNDEDIREKKCKDDKRNEFKDDRRNEQTVSTSKEVERGRPRSRKQPIIQIDRCETCDNVEQDQAEESNTPSARNNLAAELQAAAADMANNNRRDGSARRKSSVSKATVISQDVIDDDETAAGNSDDDSSSEDQSSAGFSINLAPKYAHIDRFVVHAPVLDTQLSVSDTQLNKSASGADEPDRKSTSFEDSGIDANEVILRPMETKKLLIPELTRIKGWKTKTRDSSEFTDSQKDFFKLLEHKIETGSQMVLTEESDELEESSTAAPEFKVTVESFDESDVEDKEETDASQM